MRRRICVLICLLLTVFLPAASGAQQPKKIFRIGYLSSFDPASDSAGTEAIRRALRDLGYMEGQNIAVEYRYAEGQLDRLPELAAELVHLKVDIIVVAGGGRSPRAAKNTTKTIPIVMAGNPVDPVEAGLVESLAHPGGNVTGLSSLSRELAGKRLELFKDAVPKLSRVAVLYDPAVRLSVVEAEEVLPVAARTLGLIVQSWKVRAGDGFDRVFAALNKERSDGLYVPTAGPQIRANGKRITRLALKNRLPSMYTNREAVDDGGLMFYGADPADAYRRVAV